MQRVATLLEAAQAVFAERGFAAATMAEIAARGDARIGSLYHFFPNKEAVASALIERYMILVNADYAAFDVRAADVSTAEVADFLIEAMVRHGAQTRAMGALLDLRDGGETAKSQIQQWALERVAVTLLFHAPALPVGEAPDVARVLLANMKLMADFADDPDLSAARAREELRLMNRLYLEHRVGHLLDSREHTR